MGGFAPVKLGEKPVPRPAPLNPLEPVHPHHPSCQASNSNKHAHLHRARAQLSDRQGRAPHRPGPWPSAAQTHPPAPCCGAVKPLTLRSLTAKQHYNKNYSITPPSLLPVARALAVHGMASQTCAGARGVRVPQGQFKRLQPIPPPRRDHPPLWSPSVAYVAFAPAPSAGPTYRTVNLR